jgi:hypothetical protein
MIELVDVFRLHAEGKIGHHAGRGKRFDAAFRPAGATGEAPAVRIDGKTKIPHHDIVYGLQRAAEYNEEIAFCFEGTPESVKKDKRLRGILKTIRKTAKKLGVKISE